MGHKFEILPLFYKEFTGPFTPEQEVTQGWILTLQDFSYSGLSGHAMFNVSNLLDTVGRDILRLEGVSSITRRSLILLDFITRILTNIRRLN